MSNPILDSLTNSITNARTTMAGAKNLIDGIPVMLQKAKTESMKNGATEEMLAPYAAVSDALQQDSDALVKAIHDNTPAEQPPEQPPAGAPEKQPKFGRTNRNPAPPV